MNMSAIILAGGFGSRLRPITDYISKPLVDIAGKPHIARVIDWLMHYGVRNVVIAIREHQKEEFAQTLGYGSLTNLNIYYTTEPYPLGTAGAAFKAYTTIMEIGNSDFTLVMNGDNIADFNLHDMVQHHINSGNLITIASCLVEDASQYGSLLLGQDQKVLKFEEKQAGARNKYINAGIYIINKEVFLDAAKEVAMFEADIFPEYAASGRVGAYIFNGYWNDIGTLDRYWAANLYFKEKTKSRIVFGTEGWRARIGVNGDFTIDNVEKIARGIATYWIFSADDKEPKIVVGYDNRALAKEVAEYVANIFASYGINTILSECSMPTPALSVAAAKSVHGDSLGVMITASHNPPGYLGIKVKDSRGGPLSPKETRLLEMNINNDLPAEHTVYGLMSDYNYKLRSERKLFSVKQLWKNGPDFIHDAMHGSAANILNRLLRKGTCIRSNPDPTFGGISPEPIEENLGKLKELCGTQGVVGFATDGDGDRLGVVDELGRYIDPHTVLALLVDYVATNYPPSEHSTTLIKTVSVGKLPELVARHHGCDVITVPIGFRHISAAMSSGDKVVIGGEESGGFGISEHIPERDGIVSALVLMQHMVNTGKKLFQLVDDIRSRFGRFYYKRIDMRGHVNIESDYILRQKAAALGDYILDTMDGMKFIWDFGWLLIRKSGTEDVLRIYAEAYSENKLKQLLDVGMIIGDSAK